MGNKLSKTFSGLNIASGAALKFKAFIAKNSPIGFILLMVYSYSIPLLSFSKTVLRYFIIAFYVSLPSQLNAQNAVFNWVYTIDGYYDTDVTDIVVDEDGNSYVAVNYGGTLEIKELKRKLPRSPHVHALILKLDKLGKPVWVHAFKSGNDNRINDISLAPNGDILFTGFGDGIMSFPTTPGKKDTLKLGREKVRGDYHQPQMLYAARYSKNGERIWVHKWETGWAEGLSIASNSKNETYLSFYYKGFIKKDGVSLDSFPRNRKIENKALTVKIGSDGGFDKILHEDFIVQSSYIVRKSLKIDEEDNIYLFGTFTNSIYFTKTDSLKNRSYEDGMDSYLAKFDANLNFEWARKIGGQNTQWIKDIGFDDEGSVYAAGEYSFECTLSDGISVIQKSTYEYKSGSSFFYFKLYSDGELAFARYEEEGNYGTSFSAQSMAIDKNNDAHIIGHFDDTVRVDSKSIQTQRGNGHFFYSKWNQNEILDLQKIGYSPKGFLIPRSIRANGNYLVGGGLYVNDGCGMKIKGKDVEFSNIEHGRASFIFGGMIPDTERDTNLIASRKIRTNYLNRLKPLLACVSPKEDVKPNVWFPTIDSIPSREKWLSESPCGREVVKLEAMLYPNPSRGQTTLKLSGFGNGNASQIDVFSESGKLLLTQRVQVPAQEYDLELNLSNAASGIYFVRIVHGGFEKALRLVKVE
jgi:hypothetical protein